MNDLIVNYSDGCNSGQMILKPEFFPSEVITKKIFKLIAQNCTTEQLNDLNHYINDRLEVATFLIASCDCKDCRSSESMHRLYKVLEVEDCVYNGISLTSEEITQAINIHDKLQYGDCRHSVERRHMNKVVKICEKNLKMLHDVAAYRLNLD